VGNDVSVGEKSAVKVKTQLVIATAVATMQFALETAMSRPKCDAYRVAQDYIAKHFPRTDLTRMKPVISETESIWELRYELPRDTLGGGPVIKIDKRSCEVIYGMHEQ
jgi:hypothetical protein